MTENNKKLGKCGAWSSAGFSTRNPNKKKCGRKAIKTITYQGKQMDVCKSHTMIKGGTW